jgi:hypothetical protein
MGSPIRQTNYKEKIAICSFRKRVCSRFDLTREILFFGGKNAHNKPIERLDVSRVSPEEILHILAEKEIGIVITGGIQKKFQEMFLHSNIDVIWGVAGEVNEVLEAYMKGALYPGIGPLSMAKGRR